MSRAALIAVASLTLAACAAGSREPSAGLVPTVISPTAAAATAGRVAMIDSARAMLGQPYRWGGAAPGGFDCSGLVFYAAAGAGLHVPRTAAALYDYGKPIARSDVRAGDLVFMHLAHKQLHVAIALEGGRFIHAPSSGGFVRIDSLDSAAYSSGFVGARRILPTTVDALSFAAQP